jgi:hypothetical protein
MSEEVARAAAGGKGLAEEDSKLSRRRRTALGNGECWGHPSCGFIHLGL